MFSYEDLFKYSVVINIFGYYVMESWLGMIRGYYFVNGKLFVFCILKIVYNFLIVIWDYDMIISILVLMYWFRWGVFVYKLILIGK